MSDEKEISHKYKLRGRANISALKEAGEAASKMGRDSDKDFSRAAKVIERITDSLAEARRKDAEKRRHEGRGSRRKFYSHAEASVRDDD